MVIKWEVVPGLKKGSERAIMMTETCELGERTTIITMTECIKAAGRAYLLPKRSF